MEEDEGIAIEVRVGGVSHAGRYTADRHGIITVWHREFGEKITQHGGTNSLLVARALFKQLIRDAGTRPLPPVA